MDSYAVWERRPVLFTQSTSSDYEQLCSLDVLGLADTHENDQQAVYAAVYTLPTNKIGSKKRLENLIRKLKKNELYKEYNAIIEEQLQHGIVEVAPKIPTGNGYYIPHKAVVKKEAESTKLRIVYDASAREDNTKPSLNDCLHPRPSLQNQLRDILVKSRFNLVLLTAWRPQEGVLTNNNQAGRKGLIALSLEGTKQ